MLSNSTSYHLSTMVFTVHQMPQLLGSTWFYLDQHYGSYPTTASFKHQESSILHQSIVLLVLGHIRGFVFFAVLVHWQSSSPANLELWVLFSSVAYRLLVFWWLIWLAVSSVLLLLISCVLVRFCMVAASVFLFMALFWLFGKAWHLLSD